jgi:hypothetical protein
MRFTRDQVEWALEPVPGDKVSSAHEPADALWHCCHATGNKHAPAEIPYGSTAWTTALCKALGRVLDDSHGELVGRTAYIEDRLAQVIDAQALIQPMITPGGGGEDGVATLLVTTVCAIEFSDLDEWERERAEAFEEARLRS